MRIKAIKRLLKISVGETILTPIELQSFLMEAANLSNERPIGVDKSVEPDGSYRILTPNCLLLGRAENKAVEETDLENFVKKMERLELIRRTTAQFWKRNGSSDRRCMRQEGI